MEKGGRVGLGLPIPRSYCPAAAGHLAWWRENNGRVGEALLFGSPPPPARRAEGKKREDAHPPPPPLHSRAPPGRQSTWQLETSLLYLHGPLGGGAGATCCSTLLRYIPSERITKRQNPVDFGATTTKRPPTLLHLTQSTHPPNLPPVAHRVHIHIEIDLNLFSRLHLTNQPSETSRTNQITSNRIQPTTTTTGEKNKKSGPRRKPHFSNMAFLEEEEKRVLLSRGNWDFPHVGCLFVEYKLRRLHSINFLYFSFFPPSPKTLSPTSYTQSGEFVCYALGPDRLHLLSGAATDPPFIPSAFTSSTSFVTLTYTFSNQHISHNIIRYLPTRSILVSYPIDFSSHFLYNDVYES